MYILVCQVNCTILLHTVTKKVVDMQKSGIYNTLHQLTQRSNKITRINLIPVEELTRQHLQGEYKEITRVFGLARKAQFDIIKGKRKLPQEYTMGTGHVAFFYDKLKFLADRYESLVIEMQRRGYKPNPIPRKDLLDKIDPRLHNDYVPTQEAIAINRERINLRLKGE